jgi:hypothetical protein
MSTDRFSNSSAHIEVRKGKVVLCIERPGATHGDALELFPEHAIELAKAMQEAAEYIKQGH